jgi:hypothetical protein
MDDGRWTMDGALQQRSAAAHEVATEEARRLLTAGGVVSRSVANSACMASPLVIGIQQRFSLWASTALVKGLEPYKFLDN